MKANPFFLKIILIMPVMVMLIFPLVATLEVKDINVVVVDNDKSQLSRRIIAYMSATEILKVKSVAQTYGIALKQLEHGGADVVLTIPEDFSEILTPLSIDANGVNATKGAIGAQYVNASAIGTVSQWMEESGKEFVGNDISVINRYNPTLNFRNYMIPALMVVLLIIICGFLPTLDLMGEKSSGTLEAMNVTPVSKLTFVLSKLIPFWIAGIIVITVGMVIGWAVYGLAPLGNVAAVYLAAVLFIFMMSGLGVTIANTSDTMLQSIFVMFAVIIIFQLMGGLFTPISSMPAWAQYITYIVPPRYFNEIMRAVYLKGTSISELWIQYLCLAGFAIATCLFASLTYKKRT